MTAQPARQAIPEMLRKEAATLFTAWIPLTGLLLACAVIFFVGLFIGSVEIPLVNADPTQLQILFTLRLPRLLMAAVVGGCLAVAGLVYQTILRNSLADPYTLGVSSGAACFTVVGQWLFTGAYLPTLLSSFTGGLFSIALLIGLQRLAQRTSEVHLLLIGVMINFFMGALMMLVLFLSRTSNSNDMLYQLLGSFSGIWSWQIPTLASILLLGLTLLLLQSRALMAISVGDEWAGNLGFDVGRLRLQALGITSIMVAATVACVGMIGFVGLLAPHLARRLMPLRMPMLLPATALIGAGFVMLADSISRQLTLLQTELPVGVISAFLGSPLFVYLIVRQVRACRF